MRNSFVISIIFILTLIARYAAAYPDQEKAQLSLTDVTAQAVQMYLTSDNRYLYLGYNDNVKVVDMGTFALRADEDQPYDFGSDSTYSGIVGGLALSSTRLYVSKDDGKMLYFSLDDLDAEPNQVTIASGTELGKMAINANHTRLYIVDKDNNKVIVYTVSSAEAETIDPSPSISGAAITDMILVPSVSSAEDYIYLATNKGLMFYIVDGETTVTEVTVGDSTDTIQAIAYKPNKDYIYAIKSASTIKSVLVLSPTTLSNEATVEIKVNEESGESTYNTALTGLVSADVTNPTSTYTFVSGLLGISVIDGNNDLIDADSAGSYQYNPISIANSRYGPLTASTDGYLYMSNSDGSVSVVTANPYVTIVSVTYSSGGSSMSTGESATITFQSDEDGTYSVLVGGSVDESGTALIDTAGSSTGSVTAATDKVFTFNYDDNSANLSEGSNTVFIFVDDSDSNTGRGATTISVDTPPPAVTVNSTGFGTGRIYVNFDRLDISDINYYNVYVSTDADAVANKTVTPTQVSQPSSGTTVAAEIDGLSNGSLYYASVEAIDNGGNVGALATTFADGSRITGTPEQTVGPAELSGEKGCSLGGVLACRRVGVLTLLFVVGLLLFVRVSKRICIVVFVFLIIFFSPLNLYAEESSPQWLSTEVKGGFWLPMGSVVKQFFDPCCHLTGMVNQGFLYKSKYGAEVGVGFMSENGTAIGAASGAASQDRFNLFLLPIETNLVFRADFLEDQVVVPFVKFGGDYVYFRESLKGDTTNGVKYGIHVEGGIQILLDIIDKGAKRAMEDDYGINDVYWIMGARYNWIDDFGGGGLNLSSMIFSFGLLFEY